MTPGPSIAILEAAKQTREREMTITESRLSLDPAGDDFVLRRVDASGAETTIALSETDISRSDLVLWHLASFRCAAKIGRFSNRPF